MTYLHISKAYAGNIPEEIQHKWMTRYYVFQDLNELELPKTCKTEFPDVDDLLNFKLIIYPDEVTSRENSTKMR